MQDMKFEDREAVLSNGKFLQKVERVMGTTFGEDTTQLSDEELVDMYYEKFRHSYVNTLDAMRLHNKTKELDDEDKLELRNVYEVFRSLPSFYEDDNVSTLDTFIDYSMGIFSDPLTYASLIGGSGAFAKVAATSLVAAGLKNATASGLRTAGLRSAALTSGSVDFVASTLGDKYIQNAEQELELREEFSIGRNLLSGVISAVPSGAAFALSGLAKGSVGGGKKTIEAIREGKRIYLESTDAGRAFLNNSMEEGSFVRVKGAGRAVKETLKRVVKDPSEAALRDNVGYIKNISGDNVTVVLGRSDTGDEISETLSKADLVLEDPFSPAIQARITKQIEQDASAFNREGLKGAEEGFIELQKVVRTELGIKEKDMVDLSFKLNVDTINRINNAFLAIIPEAKLTVNPGKRITQVIADAITSKELNPEVLTLVLNRYGVSNVEFAGFVSGSYMGSIREAGKTLKQQSDLKKQFVKFIGNDPLSAFARTTQNLASEASYASLTDQAKGILKQTKGFTKKELASKATNITNHMKHFVSGQNKITPEAEEYFTKFLAERGKASKVYEDVSRGRINTLIRLGMIAQPATTLRNVLGGVIRSPVDFTARSVDNGLTLIWNMIPGGRPLRPVDWKDGIDHITAMYNPVEFKMLTDFIITQKPDVQKQLFSGPEAIKEARIVQASLKGEKRGILNATSDWVERGFLKINVLNGLQDRFMKSQAFIVGLKHALKREGEDLYDYISKGKIGQLDDKIIQEAIDWSLEFNYQTKGLEHQIPLGTVLQKLSERPFIGAAVVPFPKFLFNSMKYMYEHSLVASPKWMYDVVRDTAFGNAPLTSAQKQRYIRRLSQQVAGTGLIMTSLALRNSSWAGQKWNELTDYDGGVLDISTWYPLAPALWVAEFITQISEFFNAPHRNENTILATDSEEVQDFLTRVRTVFGKEYVNIGEYRSIGSMSEELFLDMGKAFGGPSTRSGVFKLLSLNQLGMLVDSSDRAATGMNLAGQYAGSVLGALFTPLKLVTDIQREFSNDDTMRYFREARSSDGFFDNFTRVILKDLPYGDEFLTSQSKYFDIDEKGRLIKLVWNKPSTAADGGTEQPAYRWALANPRALRHSAPLLKQFTGAYKRRERNLFEKELTRLGIPEFKLFRRTRVPEYDTLFNAVSSRLLTEPMLNLITSPAYRDVKDLDIRKEILLHWVGRYKSKISRTLNESHDLGLLNSVYRIRPALSEAAKRTLLKQKFTDKNYNFTSKFSFKDLDAIELRAIKEVVKGWKELVKGMPVA